MTPPDDPTPEEAAAFWDGVMFGAGATTPYELAAKMDFTAEPKRNVGFELYLVWWHRYKDHGHPDFLEWVNER